MTLRRKTLTIICITLLGLLAVQYIASQNILINSFNELEKQDAGENLERARDALSNDIDKLDSAVGDWAPWDDTYKFVQDGNKEYIESNLDPSTLVNLNVNFMLFFNTSGQLVYGKAVDLKSKEVIPIPRYFQSDLSPNNTILQHDDIESKIRGLFLFTEGPALIASQPIVTSAHEGPIQGTLIMGRYLDSEEVEHLAGITHLSLSINRFDYSSSAIMQLSKETPVFIQPKTEESITGYALLNDIGGNPILVLEADMPRRIHEQGKDTLKYIILSILVAGIVFGVVTASLLEKNVLSRLSFLSSNVSMIGHRGDHSARVSMTGKDELSNLANDINNMLEALESSQDKLRKSEERNRAVLNAIPDLMLQIKKDGTIFNYKAAKETNLFSYPDEILNKKINEVLPEDVAKKVESRIEQALQTNNIQVFQYKLPVNGNIRDFEARIVVSGKDEVLGIVTDITERKLAEEARKKEIVLKEIHHRIKNNLQVISSLLYLQSLNIKDLKVVDMFVESQNRIKSMALAHEKLYESKDMVTIKIQDYIQSLGNYLLQSYGGSSGSINLRLNIDDVILGVDTAIPCGLIINELVSNSLKHAFPDGNKGEIIINLASDKDAFVLSVLDNGIGFPEDIDFRNTKSLGLQLVNKLVEQMDGTIELDRSSGTEFKITFKELQYKERVKE